MQRWGLTPVINAAGTMTSLGASRVDTATRAAVDGMLGRFVLIDELQAAASRVIARMTGAAAGYVTSSSSAAVTLACAAAIAGDDLAAIEALPDAAGRERRVAVMMSHMINYGGAVPQALAASGAAVVPLGTAALCETYHLEAAIAAGLAAAVYVVSHHTVRENELPLDVFAAICGQNRVPVIVDMASEYDLTTAVGYGASCVIWSGHKFLAGPTSGIVAGSPGFIRAMYLQNRGLGRLMKAGKEAVAGAMAALEAWESRDHAAEQARERSIVEAWERLLSGIAGVSLARHPDWTGNPVTRLELRIDPAVAGLNAWELAARCMAGNPAVAVRDDLAVQQRLYLDPCNVTAAEAGIAGHRVRDVIEAARRAGDGCRVSWADAKRASGVAPTPWLDAPGAADA